jgi:hypothetical protein
MCRFNILDPIVHKQKGGGGNKCRMIATGLINELQNVNRQFNKHDSPTDVCILLKYVILYLLKG